MIATAPMYCLYCKLYVALRAVKTATNLQKYILCFTSHKTPNHFLSVRCVIFNFLSSLQQDSMKSLSLN